jgi:putative DNA methylase
VVGRKNTLGFRCERKKRAAEALSYNALVQSWPEIVLIAGESGLRATEPTQPSLI